MTVYIDIWNKPGKWQRVLIEDAARQLNHTDAFATAQVFTQPEPSEDEPHFAHLYADFDAHTDDANPDDTRKDTLKLAKWLMELGWQESDILVTFTGGSGFHLRANARLATIKFTPHHTRVIHGLMTMAKETLQLKTLDLAVYSRRRMLRCRGTVHSGGGGRCSTITLNELGELTFDEIKERCVALAAHAQPSIVSFPGTPTPFIHSLWRNTEQAILSNINLQQANARNNQIVEDVEGLPECYTSLFEGGAAPGQRNAAIFAMATLLKAKGVAEGSAIDEMVRFSVEKCTRSTDSETERERNAKTTTRSAFKSGRFFSCGTIMKCLGAKCAGNTCPHIAAPIDAEEVVGLEELVKSKNVGKELVYEGMVIGKNQAPFFIPGHATMSCEPDLANNRSICHRCDWSGTGACTVDSAKNEDFALELIHSKSKAGQLKAMSEKAGIPPNCRRHRWEIDRTDSYTHFILGPATDSGIDPEEYRENEVYAATHMVSDQGTYRMRGKSFPRPTDHVAVSVAKKISRCDQISEFVWTQKKLELVKKFRPSDDSMEAAHHKVGEIFKDWERNVHRIVGRAEAAILTGLIWFTPTHMTFGGKVVLAGGDILLAGDTSQGKSTLVEAYQKFFGAGKTVSGKTATMAGLMAGVDKVGGRNVQKLGTMALHDRKLVIFEEFAGLSPEIARQLTDARSSGVINMAKIVKIMAYCRNRRIFISNCVDANGDSISIEQFPYGCQAIPGIMHSQEDVRRLTAAAAFGPAGADLNAMASLAVKGEPEYSQEASRALREFMWSRDGSQVIFEPEAEEECVRAARELMVLSAMEIPLMDPGYGKDKIAKLAAGFAGLLFSTDATHEVVIVKKAHAQLGYGLLKALYNLPDMAYFKFSNSVRPPTGDALSAVYRDLQSTMSIWQPVTRVFMDNMQRELTAWDAADLTGRTKEGASNVIGVFAHHGLVIKKMRGYQLTQKGVAVLRGALEKVGQGKALI